MVLRKATLGLAFSAMALSAPLSGQDNPSRGKICDAGPAQAMIGTPWITPLERKVKKLSNSNVLRILRAETRIYVGKVRHDQVNVRLDLADRIAAITCG